MDKYFLITEDVSRSIFYAKVTEIEVLETKKLCENRMVWKENNGHKIIKVIKGRELEFKPIKKEIVTEYELNDTIYLGPPKVTINQYDD